MTHSGEARPFRLMVLALLYLLLAYWELIASGSISTSWWAFVPMMLAIGLLLRKSIFLYLLRVFVWFQAMMLVALLISPLAVSNAPHLVLLGVDLQAHHYLGLLGLLALVIWQGWVAYSPVVRCYLNRTPYRGS